MKRTAFLRLIAGILFVVALVVPVGASSLASPQNDLSSQSSDSSEVWVSIFPEHPFLRVGQTLQLQTSQEVYPVWSSDDPSIASVVYNTGVVTANAPGKTTIRLYYLTATNVVIRGECTVNVVNDAVILENKYFLKYSRTQNYRLSPGTDFPSPFFTSGRTYTPQITHSSSLAGMEQMYNFTQWNIEDLGDGYFVISHGVLSGYILAVDSATPSVNSRVILKERPAPLQLLSDSCARWKFFAARGYYILVPECAEGTGLVLSAVSFGEGQSLNLRYFDFNSSNSYWDLFRTEYCLDTYYDESIAEANTALYLQAIKNANAFVESVFKEEFGITIRPYSRIRFHATIDNCVSGNNAPCDPVLCGQCSLQHKNISHILYMVDLISRENNHCVVKWADRPWGMYCKEVTVASGMKEHMPLQDDETLAVAFGSNIVNFTTSGFQSEEDLPAFTISVLAHEVAHVFGLRDVYDDVGHDDQPDYCVMKRYSGTEEKIICEQYDKYLKGKGPLPQFLCDSCLETLRETVYCQLFR